MPDRCSTRSTLLPIVALSLLFASLALILLASVHDWDHAVTFTAASILRQICTARRPSEAATRRFFGRDGQSKWGPALVERGQTAPETIFCTFEANSGYTEKGV